MLAACNALAAPRAAALSRSQPRTSVRGAAAAGASPAASATVSSAPSGTPKAAVTAWRPPHGTKYAAGLTHAFASWTAENVGRPFAAPRNPDATAAAAEPPAEPAANNVVGAPRLLQRASPRQPLAAAESFNPSPL